MLLALISGVNKDLVELQTIFIIIIRETKTAEFSQYRNTIL